MQLYSLWFLGTTPAASSALKSGISYQLSYQLVPRQDATFFSKLFAIPDYTQSCPVKLYIRLNNNNNLGINRANFRTTCLGVRIGMLEFSSNLEHTVTFPGTNSPATVQLYQGFISIPLSVLLLFKALYHSFF